MRKKNKIAQMKMSFGMIFSIILMIMFLAFAFFAIRKFLNIGESAQVAQFANELQSDIDKIWKSTQGSQVAEYRLPSKIEKVCFADFNSASSGKNRNLYNSLRKAYTGEENLFFYPAGSSGGINSADIKHLDLEKSTDVENPLCFEIIEAKVKLTVKKSFGEVRVSVSR